MVNASRSARWRAIPRSSGSRELSGGSATLPLCASCERKTERLPYYLRATLPVRTAYVDYEDTAFTFDHPAPITVFISRVLQGTNFLIEI